MFDDQYAMARFSKSLVWGRVPEGSALITVDTWISLNHWLEQAASMPTTRLIHSSVLTEHRLVTDTDRWTDRHRATSSTHTSTALCQWKPFWIVKSDRKWWSYRMAVASTGQCANSWSLHSNTSSLRSTRDWTPNQQCPSSSSSHT